MTYRHNNYNNKNNNKTYLTLSHSVWNHSSQASHATHWIRFPGGRKHFFDAQTSYSSLCHINRVAFVPELRKEEVERVRQKRRGRRKERGGLGRAGQQGCREER